MQDINRISPRILTATDFSTESKNAFYHALSLSVAQRARLTLLHIGPESRKEVPWDKYPGVRDTLVEWKLLTAEAPRSDVNDQLGVGVKKMAMRDEDAYNGLVDYLRKHPSDLLVMATQVRRGLARLGRGSVAGAVAYASHSHALLLPHDAEPLVNNDSGERNLKRALFVYDHEPDPRSAFSWLNEWLPSFSKEKIEVHGLYIGDEDEAPEVVFPKHPQLDWKPVVRQGQRISVIKEYVDEFDPQLIAVMNRSSRGFLKRLRGGSLPEKIMGATQRPMLLMPKL